MDVCARLLVGVVQVSDTAKFTVKEGSKRLRETVATDGVLGLWRGNSATILRVLPYAGLHYMTHEYFEQRLLAQEGGQRLSSMGRFSAGAGAGAVATLATYPLDVIRAKMAVTSKSATPTCALIRLPDCRGFGGGLAHPSSHASGGGVLPATTLFKRSVWWACPPLAGMTRLCYQLGHCQSPSSIHSMDLHFCMLVSS